ncbi:MULTISPECIES: GNAT family N-acetyltransferase [Komagataeibacter]|uniref:N-acyltransferase YncA n=1 Tax=Komagataeibacter saccharivorans TaxID=265959 RepID=A0A347W8J4_9PROT|nr:GNAT family N-acetyltransferase [Komagataeibacter saccharivorans]AXY21187.1 N-acyltransferase YncA [Komagataeibacter saccharivorans]PYD49790.1 GNAT family N-acetyltransferase [Komagataeibacter saccharivorans]GBQ34911.1 acetyltransferase [Komagataeibacter saccharivorans NRIC 0614]
MADRPALLIRDATDADIPAIVEIVNHAIRNSTTMWETNETTVAARLEWLHSSQASGYPVLVAEMPDGSVAGYSSWKMFRPFSGYIHTVEHSVYIAPAYKRQGIGSALLQALCDRAMAENVHVMVGGITSTNVASRLLHERFGFQHGGLIPECGTKFGRWMDLLFMYRIMSHS